MHKVDPGLNNGEMVARLMGFLRLPSSWQEMLNVCVSFSSATLLFSDELIANISAIDQKNCTSVKCPENLTLDRIPVDFKARKSAVGQSLQYQQSKMELLHYKDTEDAPKVIIFCFYLITMIEIYSTRYFNNSLSKRGLPGYQLFLKQITNYLYKTFCIDHSLSCWYKKQIAESVFYVLQIKTISTFSSYLRYIFREI